MKDSLENNIMKLIPNWYEYRKQCLILVILLQDICFSLVHKIVPSLCKVRFFFLTFQLDTFLKKLLSQVLTTISFRLQDS